MTARYEAPAESAAEARLSRESATEAHFHGLVYERCGNHLLLDVWQQMTQKIQLGFAVCRLTHTPKPDYAENHQLFLKLAIGDDMNAMLEELDAHLLRGLSTIRAALRGGGEAELSEAPRQPNLANANVRLCTSMAVLCHFAKRLARWN